MTIRVGIDGFGSLGRQFLVVTSEGGFGDLFSVVAINDPDGNEGVLTRLRGDASYGPFRESYSMSNDALTLENQKISITQRETLTKSDIGKAEIDVLVLSRSDHWNRETIDTLIDRGVKKVVVPGGFAEGDISIVMGVNEQDYDPDEHHVISTGSAADNAVLPLASALSGSLGISKSHVTLVEPTLKTSGRGSMFALRTEPYDTDRLLANLLPHLNNKMSWTSVAAPIVAASWLEMSFDSERRVTRRQFEDELRALESQDQFVGIIGTTDTSHEAAVFHGDSRSVIIDIEASSVVEHSLMTVAGWFDGEWSLACRAVDTVALICESGVPGTA